MKVKTSRFQEIEVPDESLITFPEGIVGFHGAKRWVMFDCGEEGIFKWLQSVDNPELAFVVCEASLVMPSYQIMLGNKETELLHLNEPDDAVVCLIMVIPDDPMEATANLLGPIVMNSESRLGMQLVLVNPAYSARYKIFAQTENAGGGEALNAGA